ncbi:MAG: cytochrome c biogenesis protein CcsA [Bernardetiaceae bacterium]
MSWYRELAGNFGHLLVIISFVTSMVAALAYFIAAQKRSDQADWHRFARTAFWIHGLSILGVVAVLFSIIYNHYYEYHYAWAHSSNNLPTHFMISCFWEGQEGSFLLWMFWHAVLGWVFMYRSGRWEAPVMAVFAAVQAFLTSMILGVVIPLIDLKIGSSPFLFLRDVISAPIFAVNPDYVPEDGTGLNPLLQNYWMVIHPPVLFLGFAAMLIPFAYCMAGLQQRVTDWVRPALPWTLFAAAVLGIGIMMGGYWAYETLNFEGYWNWDPVENAVYVPWLILVVAIHLMVVQQRRKPAIRATIVSVIASYLLILYATFLTRSGILGDASVHSFTDLGLSEQLLLYMVFFLGLAVFYARRAWSSLPKAADEVNPYSGEFWIFLGAVLLSLMAFQVIVPTSIPVFRTILNGIGISSNIAPPADQVGFYTKFQLWFAMGLALLSGTAQLFWWKRLDRSKLYATFATPIVLTMLISGVVMSVFGMTEWKLILLLIAGVYTLVSNAGVVLMLMSRRPNLSGGAVAHVGIGLMILGVLASAGYSKIVSLNRTGYIYSKDFAEETNRDNLLLFRNTPEQMEDYTLLYKGVFLESPEFPTYINREDLIKTSVPHHRMAKRDLVHDGKTIFKEGDLVPVYDENNYYKIEYTDRNDKTFTLYPRLQENSDMGIVSSPSVKKRLKGDLYTHLTGYPDPAAETEWSAAERLKLGIGDTFVVNDYIAILRDITVNQNTPDADYTLQAQIEILDRDASYLAQPIYQIRGNMVRKIPDIIDAVGVKISLDQINPEDKSFDFLAQTTQKDWVILKAIEKPFIDLLWIGTIVMAIGMLMAMQRRFAESLRHRKHTKQGQKYTSDEEQPLHV